MTCRYHQKIPYRTFEDAQAQLKCLKRDSTRNKKLVNRLHCYLCPDGPHWHIGGDKLKRQRARLYS